MAKKIRLTQRARKDLDTLRRKAHLLTLFGLEKSQYVVTAEAVIKALEAELPGAESPSHMRAGAVAWIYAMPIESAVMWYLLDLDDGEITILIIDSDFKSMMPIVHRDFESGKLNAQLRSLGITAPLDQIDTDILM